MRLLVSARSVEEALAAAAAGADFIDLKEPSAGALGALPLETIREAVAALRARHPGRPVSATVGTPEGAAGGASAGASRPQPPAERPGGAAPGATQAQADSSRMLSGAPVPPTAPDARSLAASPHLEALLERVRLTAACGVDYVKAGIAPGAPGAHALLQALAGCLVGTAWTGAAIVPVFIADAGIDEGLLTRALELPFPALMLDTEDKDGGSLLERTDETHLRQFVRRCHARGRLSGLAGALRAAELLRLQAIGPDFAGFRSAVCVGTRRDALDADLVRRLRLTLDNSPSVTAQAA